MATEHENASTEPETPPEAPAMDEQFLSPGTARDYAELLRFIDSADFRTGGGEDDDVAQALAQWSQLARAGIPPQKAAATREEIVASYSSYPLTSTAGGRTYRLNLMLDDDFGSLKDRVVRCTQRGLDRVTAGQTECFVRTAQQHGLSWRRPKGMNFPHPLPYFNPPPTSDLQRYTEEAGVIAAALHFPLSMPAPGVELLLYRKDRPPKGNSWVLGSADVNHYADDKRHFHLNLNGRALRDATFSDATWSATIIHEMLHNLGWGHPDGSYNIRMAIENYESCIRGTRFVESEDGAYPVR